MFVPGTAIVEVLDSSRTIYRDLSGLKRHIAQRLRPGIVSRDAEVVRHLLGERYLQGIVGRPKISLRKAKGSEGLNRTTALRV